MNSELKTACGPSLHFDNVSLRLGNNDILKNINFTVDPATLHCIIGPNGGGKTSLLRSLLGQMPHTGRISINWRTEKSIGYVPQKLDFAANLPITVEDFMNMTCTSRPAFMKSSNGCWPELGEVLEMVGMNDRKKRLFGQLSGGEMQRVMLAQALLPSPKLLILDEPANGLDKTGASIMREVIFRLKSEGVTILVIHHDLREVKEIGDCVTCINREVLFSGPPSLELTADRILEIFSPENRKN